MKLSDQDKLNMAAFLESTTLSLAKNKMALPLAQDADLKNMIESGISNMEAQVKGIQQLLASHGITEGGI